MARLIAKGESTHIEDKKELEELMENFQPEIMASGNNEIEKVEEIVNKKVHEVNPRTKLGIPATEQISGEGITGPS